MHKIIHEARPTFGGERVDSRYEDARGGGVIYIYMSSACKGKEKTSMETRTYDIAADMNSAVI